MRSPASIFALALMGGVMSCGDAGGASTGTDGSTSSAGSTGSASTAPTTSSSETSTDGPGTGQATRVFSVQGRLFELACDANYVYASVSVLMDGGYLWRVPADGSAPPEAIDSGDFTDITVEGPNVLYLMQGDGVANEVRVHDGIGVATAASFGGARPWTFAVDATDFWVATGSANTMASFVWQQVPRDGSPVMNFGSEITPEALLPFELHRTSSHLVWSRQESSGAPNSPDLWWVPTTGGAATDFDLPADQTVAGFDVVDDQLFLLIKANQDIDVIQTMAIGGQPTTLLDVPGMANGGLHVDDRHIYFSTYDGAFWRADRDGANLQMLHAGVLLSSRVDGCDDFVLFSDTDGSGTTIVYAVAKP